jgi:septal ring factor EnvC (AmiA/AmiB activator)
VWQADLQQQLESMRDDLTQLENDLRERDMEAADLSRKLADARAKLGDDPNAAPPANGAAHSAVPGAMRARLGESCTWGWF